VPELHVTVSGTVQGVGFRWFVREKARRWGLTGWVQNRPDGTVELAASGAQESLDGFLRDVWTGPAGAIVAEVRPLPPTGAATQSPFTIVK
jgi:acylphosphatase